MTDSPAPTSHPSKDHRHAMMQTVAEIASLAVTISSLDEFLSQVVKRICARFDYYHVAVFLTDDAVQAAVLHAAAGSAAEEIEKTGVHIAVGSRSMIGWVAAHNQYRLAVDLSQEFFFQKNDLLPESSSEIAIPISVRSGPLPGVQIDPGGSQAMRVLGVLDLQHNRENAFDPDTILGLQTIANHLAAVIQSFRLLETTRRSLSEVSAVYHASSLVSSANNVQDIQESIYQVLQEWQYPAQLLVLRKRSSSSEDEFSLYQSNQEAGVPEAEQATLASRKPVQLISSTVEDCMRVPQPAEETAASREENTLPQQEAGDQLPAASTSPLKPFLLFDLSANSIAVFSAEGPIAPDDHPVEMEILANYIRSLKLVSAAFVPVTRLDRLEMLILVGSPRNLLLPEHLQSTISLADLASTALDRISAIQTMEKRLSIIESLDVVGRTISAQTNLRKLFEVIHHQIRSTIGEVGFFIALYEPGNDSLGSVPSIAIPYMIEMGSDHVDEILPFPLGEGLTSLVIKSQKPLILMEDVERRSRELGGKMIGSPAKSWLGVPLMVAGFVIGAIVVQDVDQERRFDEDDLRIMSILAEQVAVAIRNTRLLESLQQRAENERALNEITAQIRSSGNAQKILQTTTEELARLVGASRASITLKTDHGASS